VYILVEEPFGRERQEIAECIDMVVYVDVPQDMCVVRVVQRALGKTGADFERTIADEAGEDLARRLKAIAFWLMHYMRMRSAYIGVSSSVKQKADIVVSGMMPVDEMAQEVLGAIERLLVQWEKPHHDVARIKDEITF
jgi:uridine kinase